MKHFLTIFGAAVLAATPATSATAQTSGTASAGDPAGLVKLLEQAGYSPELGKDSYGDPQIEIEVAEYTTMVLFYGCDEKTHTGCDSIQLRAGFDRDKPWTAAEALAVAKKYRFASVWLDDTGDPWVQWDILTGSTGIPAAVFLNAVEVFGDTLEDTAEVVFADD